MITNCWADDIRPAPAARIVNCWANTNLAPAIGRLIENPTQLLTQSSVLGASGNPIEPGSTLMTNDQVELVAGGRSAGNLDAGRYVWAEMVGDYDVAVRMESLLPINSEVHAGLMIRRDLGADSPQANLQLINHNWARTVFRSVQGQSAENNWGDWMTEQPYAWLRLRKERSRITTFTGSTHGWIWRTNASVDLPNVVNAASDRTLLGLYTSSEDNTAGQTTRAVFRDLRLIDLSPLPVARVDENTAIRITLPAVDFNNPLQQLNWSLGPGTPIGVTIDANTGDFSWTPTEAQGPSTNMITVTVTDNGVPSLSDTKSFQVVVNEVNGPPVLGPIGNKIVDELSELTFAATAADADLPVQGLSFTLTTAPSGAAMESATGRFTWTPTEDQGPSTNLITIRVSDGVTNVAETIEIVVREVNAVPSLATIDDQTAYPNRELSFGISASDPDQPSQPLGFSLVLAPAGTVIDSATGRFTWTPGAELADSSHPVTVQVSDNGSPALTAQQTFTINVGSLSGLVLEVPSDQRVDELQTWEASCQVTDPEQLGRAMTFELLEAPTGMVIAAAVGQMTWTPTEEQGPSTNRVLVRVHDGGSPMRSATNSFVVVVNEMNVAPVLAVPGDQAINELATLTITNTATDADVPANPLTFSLVTAPSGVTLDPATGVLVWTPTEAQGPSTNVITVRVADNGTPALDDTKSFEVVVNEVNSAPDLVIPEAATISRLVNYSANATATDADFPANLLSFALVSGPAGLSVSPSGVIAWTPAVDQGPSTNLVTVCVFDDGIPSLSTTNSYPLMVRGAVVPPAIYWDPATVLSGGEFRFRFAGTSGQRYVIQRSDDLIGWLDVQTNTMGSNPVDISVRWETNTHRRFFRVFGWP